MRSPQAVFDGKHRSIALLRAFFSEDKVTKINTACFIEKDLLVSSDNDVHRADSLVIEFEKHFYPATCIGFDGITNVAVIRLHATIPEAVPVTFEQALLPNVGTRIANVNYQQGLNPCVLPGIVTGLNYIYGDKLWPTTLIRVNLPSDHGESGSPIFDLKGHCIGLFVVHLSDIHSSFAIPARALQKICNDIIHCGSVQYGYVGVETEMAVDPKTQESGVYIRGVTKTSPASVAGIQANDKILKIGGVPINFYSDLVDATFFTYPGQNLIIAVNRNGKEQDFSIRVAEHPSRAQSLKDIPIPSKSHPQDIEGKEDPSKSKEIDIKIKDSP